MMVRCSRATALAVFLAAAPLTLYAQAETGSQATPPMAADTKLRAGPIPRAVVSEMIQSALERPHDPEAWTALARTLPRMDGELSGLMDAAGVADSLAAVDPPGTGPLAATGRLLKWMAAGTGRFAVGMVRALQATGGNGLLIGGFLITGMGVFVVLRRVSPSKRPQRADDEDSPRLWTAQHLASNGLPASEIAVRTGLSRDALNLLSKIAPASREAALPSSVPPTQPTLEAAIPTGTRSPVDYLIPGVRPSAKAKPAGPQARQPNGRGTA